VSKTGLFDHEEIEDVRTALGRWVDSAEAGEMPGDEMLSRLHDAAELLDDAIAHLRRALGW
jgi:hypothetical protein